MAKIQYVVNETFEQAAKRERELQKEKAIILRLMADPHVQEIADHFIKLGRLPDEKEVLYHAKIFGKPYKDWIQKSRRRTLRLAQAFAFVFLVGNLTPPKYNEVSLVALAVVFWGMWTDLYFELLVKKRMSRIEMAVCFLVDESFRQTPPTNRP